MQGGLWVGGKAVLTISTLSFSPNGMNRALHASPEELEVRVPLSSITDIHIRRGFITDIIDVHSAIVTLTIRCFKAKSFVVAIEAARRAVC